MKRYLLFLSALILVALNFTSCSNKDDNEVENVISVDDLPSKAISFLNSYFRGYEIIKVEKDVEGSVTFYEVDLQDGYEVVFNSDGDWQEVDAPYGKSIPTGFVPEPILQTLDYQYNGYGITEINKEGENYHIVLSNNQGGDSIDLIFNQSGEIIDTSQY